MSRVGSRSAWMVGESASAEPAMQQNEIDEQAARQREMLAAKREENIRRREQQRREREAETERVLLRNQELNARRAEKIRAVEEAWLLEQEKQREKDDALAAFIRTARERRGPPPLPSFSPHSCMHEHAHACARKPHAQQTTRQTDRSTHYTHRRAQQHPYPPTSNLA